jgi:hypothetical protein
VKKNSKPYRGRKKPWIYNYEILYEIPSILPKIYILEENSNTIVVSDYFLVYILQQFFLEWCRTYEPVGWNGRYWFRGGGSVYQLRKKKNINI